MRALNIVDSLRIGGAEKIVVDLVQGLNDRGILTDVLLLNGVQTNFKLMLLEKGIKVYCIGNNNNIYNPFIILQIAKHIKKYDVVHVHLFPAQYWTALSLFLLGKNKPYMITTEHSTTNKRRKLLWFRFIERFIYSKYDRVVAISEEAMQLLKCHLRTKKGLLSINNGVDLSIFENILPYDRNLLADNLDCHDVILIMVARFEAPKDHLTVIKALNLLPENVKLLFVGDGKMRESCTRKVIEMGLQDRVFFLGIRSDVPQLLKTADVVILSSQYEGLSLSSIEGMAVGKPFVASDVNGLSEVVKGAGVLFQYGNEIELSKIIKNLMIDIDYYNNIANKCIIRSQDYSFKNMLDQYCELYETKIRILR